MALFFKTALLFIVIAGTVLSSVLGDLASGMKAGEWKDITASMNGFNSGAVLVPASGNGNIIQYSEEATWDPVGKGVYIIGTARPYTYPDNQGWVKYDEADNTWKKLPTQPFDLGFHEYDHAALNPATGDFYLRVVGGGVVWRYGRSAGSWSRLPDIVMDIPPCCAALEFFPEMGGLVFFNGRDDGEVYFHRPGTASWTKIADGYPMGELDNLAEYSAAHKRVFFGGGDESSYYPGDQTRMVYQMDSARAITRIADPPVNVGSGSSIMTVDPVSGNLLVFDYYSTNSYEYNVASGSWRLLSVPHPRIVAGVSDRSAVAASIPDYGVIMVIVYDFGNSKVHLYKHSETASAKAPCVASELSVVSAFPNPFSGSTALRLPPNSEYSIFSVAGRLVEKGACGSGAFTWKAGRLPGGVYLLRARASGRVMGMTLMLQK